MALFLEVFDGEDGDDFFTGLEIAERGHGLAFAGDAGVRNFVDFEPVDAAGVGETEQIGVGGFDDELGDEVLVTGFHADAAGAAATLLAVGGEGRALEVAGVGDGDGDLLVGDEVLELEVGGVVEDEGAALVAVTVADVGELGDDDLTEAGGGVEDELEGGDVFADLGEFAEELVDAESWVRRVELELEDGVDLLEGENEGGGAAGGEGQGVGVDVVFCGGRG